MEIIEKDKEIEVVDYTFLFASGAKLGMTLNVGSGDIVEERGDRYVVNTVARTNPINPEDVTEPQTLEIFKRHLEAIEICKRKQRLPSEEEAFDMRRTLQALAKTIQ